MSTISIIITSGGNNKKTVLQMDKDAWVEDLLKKISDWNGINAQDQRVLFAGKQLQAKQGETRQKLSHYKIEDKSELFVVYQLPGGISD